MERHTLLETLQAQGLSVRAACRWSGCSRAVATYQLQRPTLEAADLDTLRQVAQANPRYGYRRVAVQSGLGLGKTWRLWKQHDFQLAPQRSRRPRRRGQGSDRPIQATHPNHVWTYDFLHDQLADGRPYKTLSILDEFTRECLTIYVAHTIHATDVVRVLRNLFRRRGAPEFLRSDNGSEFTAEVVKAWLATAHVGPTYIDPGAPWQNGYIESFHDKFRDECLNREWFTSLTEAQVIIERWRKHYNTQRPHSALDYQTPAQFAATYSTHSTKSLISRGHKK